MFPRNLSNAGDVAASQASNEIAGHRSRGLESTRSSSGARALKEALRTDRTACLVTRGRLGSVRSSSDARLGKHRVIFIGRIRSTQSCRSSSDDGYRTAEIISHEIVAHDRSSRLLRDRGSLSSHYRGSRSLRDRGSRLQCDHGS